MTPPRQDSDVSPLSRSIQFAKGVGPKRAELFQRMGIETVEDLLHFSPKSHLDLRRAVPIESLRPKNVQVIVARPEYVRARMTRAQEPFVEAMFTDGTGYLTVLWFHRIEIADHLKLEQDFQLVGKVERAQGFLRMVNPRLVLPGEDSPLARDALMPVYALTEGLTQEMVREAVQHALEKDAPLVPELLPAEARTRLSLPGILPSLRQFHFPPSEDEFIRSRTRLAFDEFLVLQTALFVKRAQRARHASAVVPVSEEIDRRIRALFPFPFTPEQDAVVCEVARDLGSGEPMGRLLQGDVGTGKTVVAVYAMLATIARGFQAILLAPTEILAKQHARTLEELLARSRVRRGVLTGSSSEREEILRRLKSGELDLLVGTHALLEPDVHFARLGIVVVDEQHKFGVEQRARLQNRRPAPHLLAMTATPIPRSLSLTWFGDLDLSVLRNRPAGRQPPQTCVVGESDRARVYEFVSKQARTGGQAIVVCPRISGSSEESLQSVEDLCEFLDRNGLRDLGVGMLHGRMGDTEKDVVLRRFRLGELRVLVATVVVEVGIDVPAATVLVVENAERFGLSQLHQIRGRVGRGDQRGTCFLVFTESAEAARERLDILSQTSDGFEIAEADARYRGIGEIVGKRQHGSDAMRIGEVLRDRELLEVARNEAQGIVARDPTLQRPENFALRRLVLQRYGKQFNLVLAG